MQRLPGSTTFLQIHKIPWPWNYSSKVAHRVPFSVALWEQALPAVRSPMQQRNSFVRCRQLPPKRSQAASVRDTRKNDIQKIILHSAPPGGIFPRKAATHYPHTLTFQEPWGPLSVSLPSFPFSQRHLNRLIKALQMLAATLLIRFLAIPSSQRFEDQHTITWKLLVFTNLQLLRR